MNKNKIKNQKSIKNFFLSPFSFYLKFIFTFFLLTSLSCDKATKPETVTFSGTVTLENESDYSGVKVSLYKPVELDTTLVRINQQYPQIGVQISQETEFDHREYSALYSTSTNANGAWKIEEVTPGTYNVVAEKDSFGWQQIYEKQSGSTNFNLYHNIYLNSISNSTFVFESGKSYLINKDVIMSNMTSINFKADTKIIFSTNNDLRINNSTLIFPDTGWVYITSDEGITNAKLLIEESNFSINRLVAFSLNKGIKFENCTNGIIKNCYFRDNGQAILPEFCTNLSIENIIVKDNLDGILTKAGSINITKSILIYNNKGIENLASDIQITNSLLMENFIGATFISAQTSKVEHCEFNRNNNSSLNIIGNNLEVYYNNFLNDSSCSIYVGSEYANSGNCFPQIHTNNLLGNTTALSQSGNPYYLGTNYSNKVDIDAKENFWNTIIESQIELRIVDKKNDSRYGVVDYSNYKFDKILNTGI